ncbi:hypothetical protein PROFUN_10653 [Planoprotostelium fungivorum]|uniref:Uncharacterized protein n=1 Tax=Planoprotostelium fungivorum TaxID=1890364 RepID=A0A2P6MUT1_9EUKA|nr:hypothetical protein PROFUN_10653 [Planoprotostelium fungivorum]
MHHPNLESLVRTPACTTHQDAELDLSARQRGEDKLFYYREYEKREKRASQESQEEHHMSTPRGQFVSFLAGRP